MLVVETIAKIRRLSLVQGKSIKAICRELKISRKVVRKVLRSGETEFRYERKHQTYPRMGAWREELDRLLSANAVKPQRERLTLIRIFEELRGLGYDGSYSSVWRHAQNWETDRGSAAAEAYIPLSFAPGEAYQFDWSHEIVLLGGTQSGALATAGSTVMRHFYFASNATFELGCNTVVAAFVIGPLLVKSLRGIITPPGSCFRPLSAARLPHHAIRSRSGRSI